jgi:hypothetical protein
MLSPVVIIVIRNIAMTLATQDDLAAAELLHKFSREFANRVCLDRHQDSSEFNAQFLSREKIPYARVPIGERAYYFFTDAKHLHRFMKQVGG